MGSLRAALTRAGATRVRTYLQSGNIVADLPAASAAQASVLVQRVIDAEFDVDVPVLTRTPEELRSVIAANPFPSQAAERPNLVRVVFLTARPSRDHIARLPAVDGLRRTCCVLGEHLYVDYRDGYHTTSRTAPFLTRALGVDGTERNWRTVLALAKLAVDSSVG